MSNVVLTSLSPITILQTDPDEVTTALLFRFYSHNSIKQFIKHIRQICNVPEEGLDIRKFEEQEFEALGIFQNDFIKTLTVFLPQAYFQKYHYPKEFLNEIILLLLFNATLDVKQFMELAKCKFEFVLTKGEIAKRLHEFEGYEVGAIIIPFSTSKQKLKDWIDANWSRIEQGMDEYMQKDITLSDHSKRLADIFRIITLHRAGKSFQEISKIFTDEKPDDQPLQDYTYIEKLYNRNYQLFDLFPQYLELVGIMTSIIQDLNSDM